VHCTAITGERIKAARDPGAMKSLIGMCQKAWGVGKVVGKRHRKKGFGMGMGMGMGVRMEGSEPGAGTLRPRPGNAHKLRFNACKLPASTSWTSLLHYRERTMGVKGGWDESGMKVGGDGCCQWMCVPQLPLRT